ncbi:HIT-like protein [Schizopora paradoxa]|uniref:HIT-like protein n=1 Tax=Schizopora paradoxa TaxID=27342 RepID=A0A0H2R3M5_9AGAM|nr:HIT-like protein [Schizopora paradoxa]
MTSQILSSHINRDISPQWKSDSSCPFCRIISGDSPAFKVYETENVIAVLDILPLRPGHTLIIPKIHCKHVSELPDELAGAVGQAVSKVAKALTQALDNDGLNVVCNQEYAQAVPHVHYHVIPAPTFEATSKVSVLPASDPAYTPTPEEMLRKEFQARRILNEEDARNLVQIISSKL